jgi:hypothetical protein
MQPFLQCNAIDVDSKVLAVGEDGRPGEAGLLKGRSAAARSEIPTKSPHRWALSTEENIQQARKRTGDAARLRASVRQVRGLGRKEGTKGAMTASLARSLLGNAPASSLLQYVQEIRQAEHSNARKLNGQLLAKCSNVRSLKQELERSLLGVKEEQARAESERRKLAQALEDKRWESVRQRKGTRVCL